MPLFFASIIYPNGQEMNQGKSQSCYFLQANIASPCKNPSADPKIK
jgi:hypothetical protein